MDDASARKLSCDKTSASATSRHNMLEAQHLTQPIGQRALANAGIKLIGNAGLRDYLLKSLYKKAQRAATQSEVGAGSLD